MVPSTKVRRLEDARASSTAVALLQKHPIRPGKFAFLNAYLDWGHSSRSRVVPALRALGTAVEVSTLMGAKHGAKRNAVWTKELSGILLEGIETNDHGKQLAITRLKALHPLPPGRSRYPRDFEKWLHKVFDKEPGNSVWLWLTFGFWQQEVDRVLVEGIFARHPAKHGVVERIRTVWPKLSVPWLRERMEEVARLGLPRWMDARFWVAEVDPILIGGLRIADNCLSEGVGMVLKACPQVHVETVWARLRGLRKRGGDDVHRGAQFAPANGCELVTRIAEMDQVFRTAEVDPILLDAIRQAKQCEREAVDRVLRRFCELRIGTIWARLRRLREQQRENLRTGIPFAWTGELDDRLIRVHGEAGLSKAVSEIQAETGWPRRAILRRAHKLGIPKHSRDSRRRWTMAEFRFAIESVNHMSVREIAEEIGRSEKSVWEMFCQRGIEARFQDGCTMRELAERLHVRRLSIQRWVEAGLLHRKRNGRIDEASLQSFFYRHPERLKWPLFDEGTAFWVSELVEAERARVNGIEVPIPASSQSSEGAQAAEASTPDGTVSSTSESDPYADPGSRSNRVRDASPQL